MKAAPASIEAVRLTHESCDVGKLTVDGRTPFPLHCLPFLPRPVFFIAKKICSLDAVGPGIVLFHLPPCPRWCRFSTRFKPPVIDLMLHLHARHFDERLVPQLPRSPFPPFFASPPSNPHDNLGEIASIFFVSPSFPRPKNGQGPPHATPEETNRGGQDGTL